MSFLALQPQQGAIAGLGGLVAGHGQPGPVVVYAWNPLKPAERTVFRARLGQSLNELKPQTRLPTICLLNGEAVLAEDWDYVPEADEHVAFFTLPLGGGDGGSNPLVALLAIAVTVVGVWTANPYIIAAGVSMLAVGLLPQPTFTPISAPTATQELSPTYSVQIQGNAARLGQAVPVPYGYHLMLPDFAAQPYSEFDSAGDQFYHALLCLGVMESFTLVNTFIDDTPLAHFVDVQTQLVGPSYSSTLTLVNPCVVNAPEVAQQDMLFGTVVGPFAASGPGWQCSQIGIDILCPRGLYFAADNGTLTSKSITWMVEARRLTSAGAVSGTWFLLGTETLTAADNKPIRRSYLYNVPPARYQVRVQRTTARDDNTRAGHDIQWLGMRAYLTVPAPLDPKANYLALRMKATSQLSGLSQRKVSVLLQRHLKKWHPSTGWGAYEPSNSIAWALADILKNADYGGQLSDDRIDLLTLYQLDQLWTDRGDEFNGIFDKRTSVWSALATVARVGRSRPIMRGSVFTFVRDSQQDLPVALFNMRNIERGSFSLDYVLWNEDAADGVELEFFDRTTWSSNYVTFPLPGGSTPVNPAKMSIVGITDLRHAQREAAYYVAEAVYRNATVSFTTELEGFLPGYGDLIAVSHDVANWGNSGDLVAWDGTSIATASEDIVWSVGNNYCVIQNAEGDVLGPYRVEPGPSTRQIKFLEAVPGEAIYTSYEKERTRYALGPANAYAKLCRVVSIDPQGNDRVQIKAVVEDVRVHTADGPYLGAGSGGSGGSGASRVARYAPNATPAYDAASDAQRSSYGFFSREDQTVGTNNDPGYSYDT